MTINAPAKLNLGLHVIRKRDDGFHDIETVMVRIGWFDTIAAEPAEGFSMSCDDPALPVDDSNLCLRAAYALATMFEVDQGVHLRLTKRIPHGAGLGGGSSDAASTLMLLAKFWDIPATKDDLIEIAASLGSDVPFFLVPSPALARGRGERLTPLATILGKDIVIPFSFVVLKPTAAVSTFDAYRWVQPSEEERPDLIDVVTSFDPDLWDTDLHNDFESPITDRIPEINDAKTLLLEAGARYAAMSGSGSAVFGVFDDADKAAEANDLSTRAGLTSWVGRAV